MQLEPTKKQAVIRRTVRKFAEETIGPAASSMDATSEFPWDVVRTMAGLNYLGLEIPHEFGGAGLDAVSCAIVIEELSRVSGAVGLLVSVHNSVATYPVYEFGTEFQRSNYLVHMARGEEIGTFCLTEPNAGSDASSLETNAVRDGDSWVLNGNKVFVTNGGASGVNLIFALSNPPKEKPRYTVFIVESGREGLEKGPVEDLMGMRGNPVCPISLHDCRVPSENILGKEGEGLKIALASLSGGRIGIASQSLGIAQACLDASIKYAKERYQFRQPLVSFGAVQNMLADMATSIDASRLLVHRAARLRDDKKPYAVESAMAKLYAAKTAVDASRSGVQIHGGYGYSKAYPVERFYRDAKVCEIYEGTSEIQRLVIARALAR